jgi:hypothetical protein
MGTPERDAKCQLQTFVVSSARASNDSLDLASLALNEVIQ